MPGTSHHSQSAYLLKPWGFLSGSNVLLSSKQSNIRLSCAMFGALALLCVCKSHAVRSCCVMKDPKHSLMTQSNLYPSLCVVCIYVGGYGMWVNTVSVRIWRCLCLTEVRQECSSCIEIISILLYLMQQKHNDLSNNLINPRKKPKANPRMLFAAPCGLREL